MAGASDRGRGHTQRLQAPLHQLSHQQGIAGAFTLWAWAPWSAGLHQQWDPASRRTIELLLSCFTRVGLSHLSLQVLPFVIPRRLVLARPLRARASVAQSLAPVTEHVEHGDEAEVIMRTEVAQIVRSQWEQFVELASAGRISAGSTAIAADSSASAATVAALPDTPECLPVQALVLGRTGVIAATGLPQGQELVAGRPQHSAVVQSVRPLMVSCARLSPSTSKLGPPHRLRSLCRPRTP